MAFLNRILCRITTKHSFPSPLLVNDDVLLAPGHLLRTSGLIVADRRGAAVADPYDAPADAALDELCLGADARDRHPSHASPFDRDTRLSLTIGLLHAGRHDRHVSVVTSLSFSQSRQRRHGVAHAIPSRRCTWRMPRAHGRQRPLTFGPLTFACGVGQ